MASDPPIEDYTDPRVAAVYNINKDLADFLLKSDHPSSETPQVVLRFLCRRHSTLSNYATLFDLKQEEMKLQAEFAAVQKEVRAKHSSQN